MSQRRMCDRLVTRILRVTYNGLPKATSIRTTRDGASIRVICEAQTSTYVEADGVDDP
jgi:hypothetical protein